MNLKSLAMFHSLGAALAASRTTESPTHQPTEYMITLPFMNYSMPDIDLITSHACDGHINFPRFNQRKARKNRRRADAAGYLSPFGRAIRSQWSQTRSKYQPHVGAKQLAKMA